MTKKVSTLSSEDKKMCTSVFWRTMTLSATYNYETMQALGFMYAMMPVINRFYKTPEERTAALKRHNELFNTTPTMGGIITGLAASMEKEASENPDFDTSAISAVKVSLMGPFAGIGDSIFWGTFRVISLGVGISLALTGNILGAIAHILLYNIPAHILRYYGVFKSYELGNSFLNNISESGILDKITRGASIVGMMTVGAMAVTMTSFSIPKEFIIQGTAMSIQGFFDAICPNILPLLLTFGCYKAVKKGVNPAMLMVVMLAFGVVGKYLGLF